MKKFLLGFFIVSCFWSSSVLASGTEQAAEDWKKFDTLLTERDTFLYQSAFEKNPDEFVNKWVGFSESFRKEAAEFTAEYGSDQSELKKYFKDIPKTAGVNRESYQFINEFIMGLLHLLIGGLTFL